jgi:hypothetical protein
MIFEPMALGAVVAQSSMQRALAVSSPVEPELIAEGDRTYGHLVSEAVQQPSAPWR